MIHFEFGDLELSRRFLVRSISSDQTQSFAYKYIALIDMDEGNVDEACEKIRMSINNGLPFEGNEFIQEIFASCLE